ncbi:MAG: YigZ family protein [Desulfuromonas sp.]|nr:MAG: YigZ family protein [Desulfuromonas sp.]
MANGSRRYPIPAQRFRCEIEVERSRFIATVQAVATAEEAQSFIAGIKAEFADANHNCWAYLVGPPGSTDRIGLSDDGEPHGVAGKPMLTTLQHAGLGDTAVVVSRYFGGIKLGKGGMVKAYTAAVQAALTKLPRTERIAWAHLELCFDYSLLAPLQQRLSDFEGEELASSYAERVTLELRLPQEQQTGFAAMFRDLTAGRGELKKAAD